MDIQFLLNTLRDHPIILFFLAAYIGGEEMIIPLAILVGHGLWSLWLLFTVCFIGTLFADLTWFLLGRHGIQKRRFFQRYKEKYTKMSTFIRKLAKTEIGLLLITKFIYGTRIFTIILISLEGLSINKFIKINSLVILIWLPIITGIGWMIGRGSSLFVNLYEHPIELSVGIIAIIVLFHIARNYLSKKLLPKELQK